MNKFVVGILVFSSFSLCLKAETLGRLTICRRGPTLELAQLKLMVDGASLPKLCSKSQASYCLAQPINIVDGIRFPPYSGKLEDFIKRKTLGELACAEIEGMTVAP